MHASWQIAHETCVCVAGEGGGGEDVCVSWSYIVRVHSFVGSLHQIRMQPCQVHLSVLELVLLLATGRRNW